MKLTCDKCAKPCNLEMEGTTDLPDCCPWAGSADWKEIKDEH